MSDDYSRDPELADRIECLLQTGRAEVREDNHIYVDRQAGCPNCLERRMDYLFWNAEGTEVKCCACGNRYVPT